MLYYPGSYLPSSNQMAEEHIQFWPSGRQDYRGFISTVPGKQAEGTVVVFHGNAGAASDRAYYGQVLAPLGFRVILAEYPGYGARRGTVGEKYFVNDAKETLRLAREKFGAPIYVLGESLGCGVAAAAAKDSPVPINGILLITPWDTLLSVAREKFPWLPVRLFLTDAYDTVGNLKNYQGRISLIAAERDQIIPIHHAHTLFESLPPTKRMWTIKGAGHNDWPELTNLAWWKEVTEFMSGKI
jgi:hypothetical protein